MPNTFNTVQDVVSFIGGRPIRSLSADYIRISKRTPQFAYACLEEKDGELFTVPVQTFQTCREQLCNYISLRQCEDKEGLRVRTYDYSDPDKVKALPPISAYAYVGQGAGCLLVAEGNPNRLRKNLRVIHRYEALARNGRTRMYDVQHEYKHLESRYNHRLNKYEYTYSGVVDTEVFLLVFPYFWQSSIPLMSSYLLLVRILMAVDLPEDLEGDWRKYLPPLPGGTLGKDIALLQEASGSTKKPNPDIIRIQCRSWRSLRLSFPKKMCDRYNGIWGVTKLSGAIERYIQATVNSKVSTPNALSGVPPDYKKYVEEMAKICRRNPRRLSYNV